MNPARIIANGQLIAVKLPCTIEEFLVAQKLLPRRVVVEHNGEAGAAQIPRFATLCFGVKMRPCWIGINVLPLSAFRAR